MPDGYYYLHENGELIYKSEAVVQGDMSYFDGDLVRRV